MAYFLPRPFGVFTVRAEVVPEVFSRHAAEALRRAEGRPEKPNRKVNQTVRLDPDVLAACRHQGTGWQTRIHQVLRQHTPKPGT